MTGARSRLTKMLAHVSSKLQHVDTRHGEDFLHGRIGLDSAALVELVLFYVNPDLLRHLRARHRLPTADRRQLRAQSLWGERPQALLLHVGRVFLSSSLAGGLAEGFLRSLQSLLGRLSECGL